MRKVCAHCGGTEFYKNGNCVHCMSVYMKKRYEENRDEIKAKTKKRQSENLDKFREYNRRYRENNPDKERERQRTWLLQNHDKAVAKKQRRRANKVKTGGSYTAQQWECLCKKYDYRCLCCGKKLKLTPDHIIPLSKGGTSDISNIQPLCITCNKRKGTKTIDYRKPNIFRWLQEKFL